MVEGNENIDPIKRPAKKRKKHASNLLNVRNKKSCCGKKKCVCNVQKGEVEPCSKNIKPNLINRICTCGKLDCECYGFPTHTSHNIPKFVDVYKCGYTGDELKPICVCGKPDCTCHGHKTHAKKQDNLLAKLKVCEVQGTEVESVPPCVCGKPYCRCRKKFNREIENVPSIEIIHIDACDVVKPMLKNYCVCRKPDCTCYQENRIVDNDQECSYRVPLVRPLCVCGKIDCNCNIDRYGMNKILKKIEIPSAPARCICGKIFCECNIGRVTATSVEKISRPDEEPFKIEIEKSAYARDRGLLMKNFEIPSIADAKKNLGKLTGLVYNQCESVLKTYIPHISQIAYGDLWVSPSDLLIPHVCLKAPLTRKYMQALTHEGILDIGHQIELKFIRQMEIEKEEALESQKQELMNKFQDSIKQTIKDAEVKEKAACQRELEKMSEEFELKLKEEINALQTKLKEEYLNQTRAQDAKINAKWEYKLKLEVEETTRNITKKFLAELDRQEKILAMHFKIELMKKEMQKKYDIEKLRLDHKKEMRMIQHRLECNNIANMMYILVMERRKCNDEKEAVEEYYKKKIQKLDKKIDKNETTVKKLKEEVENQIKNVQLRETCVLEILRQYQKFINFALKSAPTQAEFLLSIEKLMLFELTDTLKKLKPQSSLRERAEEVTLPWAEMSPSQEFETLDVRFGLEVKDYHDCVHEFAIPKEKDEMVLPAFIFKDKLYVREDFRNMMSQGIKPSESHALWNDDVNYLMDTLKRSVSEEETDLEKKINSSIESRRKVLRSSTEKASVIQFKLMEQPQPLAELAKKMSEEIHSIKERVDTKTSLKYTVPLINHIDYSKIGEVEESPTLLGIESSLELLSKKYNTQRKKHKQKDSSFTTISEKEIEEEEEVKGTFADGRHSTDAERRHSANANDVSVEKLDVIYKSSETLKTANDDVTLVSMMKGSPKRDRFLSLDIRDSLILRQASLAKATKSFSITPNDSIEVKKESEINAALRQKSSKLVTARDSVVLLRQSRSLLKEPAVCTICHKKGVSKEKEIVPRECEKCAKNKESIEIFSDGVISKKSKSEEHDKQIKLSHVEIISLKDNFKNNVSFQNNPSKIDDEIEAVSKPLINLYKPAKKKTPVKKKPHEDQCKKQSFIPMAQIIGDRDGKEHLQNEEEFTIDRMRSFISLLSDHPNLIKMFTACQR
ncbi:uncharacterized protein LOC130891197 [Diorhabda carinulata]|uniref:uncharacterized protein LOC130891197 n=1 Tax=Diorhabda carinulata TaxID=1163345 RepID=UPI0025A2362F|nr:uncharacterized protein LOC130891197 [Diorhabda carinulata]